MIREQLEAGRSIPTNTKPAAVAAVMAYLVQQLAKKLEERYEWFASCTVAVEAGIWGGERRRNRRLKLAKMIGECAKYLGVPDPVANLPKGWERHGLYYGYGAFSQVQKETGASTEALVMVAPRTVGPSGRKVKTSFLEELLRHEQRRTTG